MARLLAAFVVTGLFFMALPGTVLGVWNLVGISSERQLAGVPAAWIQAHGHAQFFGWVGTFIIGISLYALPKFRGAMCRSVPAGWAMWAMWSAGVGLRWIAGVAETARAWEFRAAAALELAVALLLLWQVTARGPKYKGGQVWELPIFAGFGALVTLLGWQLLLTMGPLAAPALPAGPDRVFISIAIWGFAFPVVAGYCAKFFPGLVATGPGHAGAMRAAMALAGLAAIAFAAEAETAGFAASLAAVGLASWSLRIWGETGRPKTAGVYRRYPEFARLAWAWLALSAVLGLGASRPGMLGASRHAFTVGFLATLIFSIGPRILPSFLNSRELWSARLMQVSLILVTAGCALRVISEPLAYGSIVAPAWKTLPVSAFAELTAVLLFGFNLAMSLATPVPAWFGRRHVNDRMSVYWLVAAYPATRRILVESGLRTLEHAREIPKSLTLREAAQADGIAPELLTARLGDFFEARLPRSQRQPLRTSESTRSTNQ